MLPGFMGSMMMGSTPREIIDVVRRLGLTSGLQLCLDAGDIASATGSSAQNWTDLSGGGSSFQRGNTSGATATDPTFNGTPGGLSAAEYYSFDGGDYFQYPTANATWINNLHKTGSKFTFAGWVYFTTLANTGFFGTEGSSGANVGVRLALNPTGTIALSIASGSGTSIVSMTSTATVTSGQWSFVSFSFDYSSLSGLVGVNGTIELKTYSTVTFSTGNATYVAQIGARGNSANPFPSGSRMASFIAWQGAALSSSELLDLYNQTKGRFGL